jgi:hypothetical protein
LKALERTAVAREEKNNHHQDGEKTAGWKRYAEEQGSAD